MAKRPKKQRLTEEDLNLGNAVTNVGPSPEDIQAYEHLMADAVGEQLDQEFRQNAGRLATVPGMSPSPDDERMLLPTPGRNRFTPGVTGWQDTAANPIGLPNDVTTYAQDLGIISQPFGRAAALAPGPAVQPGPAVKDMQKVMVDEDPWIGPEMFAPAMPAELSARVPSGMAVQLPGAGPAAYEHPYRFGAELEQLFSPSANIEHGPLPPMQGPPMPPASPKITDRVPRRK